MIGFRDRLLESLKKVYTWVDARSGGALTILHQTLARFGRARASEGAASMAYYMFFSLFPLLLFLVAAGSFFLERNQVYDQVVAWVGQVFPTSQSLIEQNVQQVIRRRGAVGLMGLVGLLWSAMSFFGVLTRHLTRAWAEAKPRGFVQQRLMALRMVTSLAGLLILGVFANLVLNFLPQLPLPLTDRTIFETAWWPAMSSGLPWAFAFLMFLSLYRWVPNVKVKWAGALWGALVAALAWELAAKGFAWYLASGLVRYELVYGSLGAVVALMFWSYVSALITLFGAHLAAVIDGRVLSRRDRAARRQVTEMGAADSTGKTSAGDL